MLTTVDHRDDKFLSKLMSKDSSVANSSSRIYYRSDLSSSIPFTWETRPGTPKHPINDNTIPPLTPPPSYLSNSNSTQISKVKNLNNSKLLNNYILSRFGVKKRNNVTPTVSWSSKSSSLSSSSSSSSSLALSRSSSTCYSFPLKKSNSLACFGVKSRSLNASFPGRKSSKSQNSMVKMKNALKSIVGHK